jgi:hypothetical protein
MLPDLWRNVMFVTRKSVITGVVRSRDIPVKKEDLEMYESGACSVSEVMPYLSSEDREFILCGITTKEWKNAFSEQLQNIVNDKIGATR